MRFNEFLNEGEVVAFPKKHRGDISNMHSCPKCGGDTQGGKYQGHEVQVCMPCKQVYLPPNSGIDQQGNKIVDEMDGDGAGRDGSNRKSHSTYGSRDKHNTSNGPDMHLGPKHMMTSKDMQDRALDALKKTMSKPENMAVLKRLKTKEGVAEEKTRLDPKCWTGKKIGNPKTKVKGGVRVNNCVPAESVEEGFDYTAKDLGNDYSGFPSNHGMKHKFLAKIKPEKRQLYKDKMNNTHNWDSLFALFKVAKARGDIIEQGVAEGSEDKIKQLKQDYATAIHWSKNDTNPHKREAARQKAEKIKAHLEKQYKQGVAEGSRTPQDWEVKSAVWGLDKQGVYQEPQNIKSHFVRADRSSRAEEKAKREYEPGRQTWEIHPRGNKEQGVAEGERMKTASGMYRDQHTGVAYRGKTGQDGNDSYMTPDYLIQKYQERLAQIASGPYKRPKEVAQLKSRIAKLQGQQGVAEDYNPEYDDEAGMADNNLETLERAVRGIDDLIQTGDNLPEWCQEKIAVAKSMLVSVWDYMESADDAESEDPELTEEFDLIESSINQIADHNGVDPEMIWEDLESLSHDELYVFAVTSQLNEDWSKVNKKDKTDGMSGKAVKAYRRANPGSKLQTAVTTKPSKLKRGSKASKRRKSYCSRSRGQMNMHNISCAKTLDKAICKARRRWNC